MPENTKSTMKNKIKKWEINQRCEVAVARAIAPHVRFNFEKRCSMNKIDYL
jgi:hypothetical protein